MPIVIQTPAGQAARQVKSDAGATPLDSLSVPQAMAWIDANVNNLADARLALKHILKIALVERSENARKP